MPRWSENGSRMHWGYDYPECRRLRVERFGEADEPAARQIGISRRALKNIENGGQCRKTTFRTYCDALSIHPSVFDIPDPVPDPTNEPSVRLLLPEWINFRSSEPPPDMESRVHYDAGLSIILSKFRVQFTPGPDAEEPVYVSDIRLEWPELVPMNFPQDGLVGSTWSSLSAKPTTLKPGPGMWHAEYAPPWSNSVNANRPIELSSRAKLREEELAFRPPYNDQHIRWKAFWKLFDVNPRSVHPEDELRLMLRARLTGHDGVARQSLSLAIPLRRRCLIHMLRYKLDESEDDILRFLQPRCAHAAYMPCSGGFPHCLPGQRLACARFS